MSRATEAWALQKSDAIDPQIHQTSLVGWNCSLEVAKKQARLEEITSTGLRQFIWTTSSYL